MKIFFVLSFFLIGATAYAEHGLRDWASGASNWKDPAQISSLSPYAKHLVEKSLRDLPGVIDTHLHLICRESKNGCYVPQKLFSLYTHPISTIKTQVMLSALGIQNDKEPDSELVHRMMALIENFPLKPYIGMLFAFSATYDRTTDEKILEKTGLEVPNPYLFEVVRKYPRSLLPVYSLHPFQKNLDKGFASLNKPRFFKVLPNSMHFSPDDDTCALFFETLAKQNFILITHVGNEHSVEGGGIDNSLGNPLFFEKWLRRFPKLRIIFAHTGGSGRSPVEKGKDEENFNLVLQLLRKYPEQTYADISASSLAPNLVQYLPKLLQASDLYPRLLYGSDYPLVAVKPLLSSSLWLMYTKGLLGTLMQFRKDYNAISEIYNYNPLLASVVIMRLVSYKGQRLPPQVFFENALRLIGSDFDFAHTMMGKAL